MTISMPKGRNQLIQEAQPRQQQGKAHQFEKKLVADAVQQIKTTTVIDGTVANYASEDSRRFDAR